MTTDLASCPVANWRILPAMRGSVRTLPYSEKQRSIAAGSAPLRGHDADRNFAGARPRNGRLPQVSLVESSPLPGSVPKALVTAFKLPP